MGKRVIQISGVEGGFAALTEDGEIYFGIFKLIEPGDDPQFGWRKALPIREDEPFEYKRYREPTALEIERYKKKLKKETN